MSPSKPSLSFVVFALNEEDRIEATVNTILKAVTGPWLADYQIILVNDGSQDRTGSIMRRLANEIEKIDVLENEKNLGQGASYKRALGVAHCEYVMVVAGDNAASAGSLQEAIEQLGKADIIIPYIRNADQVRSFFRRTAARAYSVLINLLFGLHIRYYNGAVPRRALLEKISINSDSAVFLAEMTVKLVKLGHSYVEVGVTPTETSSHRSAALRPRHLLKVFAAVMRLAWEIWRFGPASSRSTSKRPSTGA